MNVPIKSVSSSIYVPYTPPIYVQTANVGVWALSTMSALRVCPSKNALSPFLNLPRKKDS